MDKNKCSSCGETKCSCKNKDFTKAVIEIDNPEQITLMRKVTIPASMGDDTTVPPVVGKYHNVLLYYEANHKSYLYSSDGIPTLLANGLTDYEEAVNLPQINGVTLIGNKTLNELGIKTYFFDTVADMKASNDLIAGDYVVTLGFYSINDGGGSVYKITNTGTANETNIIAVGDLNANLIYDDNNPASKFGLIPDDNNEGVSNFQKLCIAVDTGHNIVIDKTYYIDVDETFVLTNDTISISGDGNGVLKFNPSESLITLFNTQNCRDIRVNGVTFENESNTNQVRLMRSDSTTRWYIDNYSFTNNTVNGSICALNCGYQNNFTPVLGTNGFNNVSILNNSFSNITKIACFNLFDTIARKIEIKNNYVHNFTNRFFGLVISNDTGYESAIAENIVLAEIDNNYVICDNDYLEESSSGTGYYTFVLLGGNVCRFTNNHIEGMKSFNEIALYDSYLSVRELFYENNVIKNNLLFHNTTNCYLIKSKGGSYNVGGLKRYYNNNTYIIEEDWQKLFDADLDYDIGFIDLMDASTRYELTNCYIDVPHLRAFHSNDIAEYNRLVVKDNYIHIKKGQNNRVLFFCYTTSDDGEIYIQNNTIIDESHKTFLFSAFNGTKNSVTYNKFAKVSINHNTFEGDSLITMCGTEELEMCDNIFTLENPSGAITTIYDSKSQSVKLKFKGNQIYAIGEQYLMYMSTGGNIVDIDNNLYTRLPNGNNQGFILAGDLDVSGVYRYFFEYEIQHTTGKQIMSFYVDYGKDATGNYIKVIDTNDVEQTLYTTDTGFNIKVNNSTTVTTSTARVLINAGRFLIIPAINYSIASTPCFVRQIVKSVKLS